MAKNNQSLGPVLVGGYVLGILVYLSTCLLVYTKVYKCLAKMAMRDQTCFTLSPVKTRFSTV